MSNWCIGECRVGYLYIIIHIHDDVKEPNPP